MGEMCDSCDIPTVPETQSSTACSEIIHGVSPILHSSYVPESPAVLLTPRDHSQPLQDHTSFLDMSHLDETEGNTSRIDETLFDASETKEHKPSVQCGTCGKILKSKGSLNLHVRRHTRDFNFSCQLCGESFLINQLLKEHVAKVHKKTGVVKCKFCGKVTTTFRGMREHVKEHAGEEHKCHDCDMSFSTKTKLKRHMSWHSKDFECNVCGKWFPSKGQLKIHSLIHDEHAQKYQCSHCNYVSIWKASINRHVKTKHTDTRQHVCDKCGNGFKEKSTLTRHMRRNSCDRPRASSMWEEL
ncbi:zinc finger protein draculin-like [Haliotis rubra]|uniref:zinc finger protein draculin-like n=1 Tax=Haliotis rubra TaxID=36100 RepID=UPI001EE50150|nr:zinc finger protein draculin-like [Haliotis rubra]